MKFLRPVWLTLFVAVLFALWQLANYYIDRPVKKLRIEILSNSPLVSVNAAITKEIQVLYKKVSVQTLSVILLRVVNTGTEPHKGERQHRPYLNPTDAAESIGHWYWSRAGADVMV